MCRSPRFLAVINRSYDNIKGKVSQSAGRKKEGFGIFYLLYLYTSYHPWMYCTIRKSYIPGFSKVKVNVVKASALATTFLVICALYPEDLEASNVTASNSTIKPVALPSRN